MRWRHPRNGLIPAAEFLPLAEKTGAIIDIGRWVLGQACRDATRWADELTVTVNLSLLQFESGDLTSVVQKALADAGLPASRLELEISEALLRARQGQDARARSKSCTRSASASRSTTSASDAGSLSSLRSFPFEKVKIDRTLVREMPGSADNCGDRQRPSPRWRRRSAWAPSPRASRRSMS